MKMAIQNGDIHLMDLPTRMPFRYGIATMTEAPLVFVSLDVHIQGAIFKGCSSDILPPQWFTKNPCRDFSEERTEMLDVIQHALELAINLRANSAFDLWMQLYHQQAEWGANQGLSPLLSNFGTTFIERALIEATCKAYGSSFADAVKTELLGIDLSRIHRSLTGLSPRNLLPQHPLQNILVRHTVGLTDPLSNSDINDVNKTHDGLPQSLIDCIDSYGLKHFKLKSSGQLDIDQDRFQDIARILEEHTDSVYSFSIDGNEQFPSIESFRDYWNSLTSQRDLKPFFQHLLFVEQPLDRKTALSRETGISFSSWKQPPPVIIDESDSRFDCLPLALQLGYVGTSHKNCKGVFRGIASKCLLTLHQADKPEQPTIMSGEDLASPGPVSVLQDLAVNATLGIESVERNGHHYFAGLSQFSEILQQQMLSHHGDLYHTSPLGWPTLTIRKGRLNLTSVINAPLGVGFNLDTTQLL